MTAALRGRATAAVRSAARDDPRPDAELIARFVDTRDPPAFAVLVERHGPLVLGVCRRALGATADADDAFQATFLVLIQKAESVPWHGSLGPWLYGVAHRIARKARFKRDRRFAVEKQVDAMPHPETTAPDLAESDELHRAFDEELAALPEAMRRAVILCELQGVSRAAAAKQLRISEGTLSSRLARARKALKDRLAKRGFSLTIPAAAAVSAKLMSATVGLANGTVGVVPVAVWALTQEALKAMAISKLKLGAVLVAAVIGLTGFGLSASGDADDKPVAKAKADPPAKPLADAAKPAGPVATVNGQDISRAEFGEYLIRKHGAKEIEGFVRAKLPDVLAAQQGIRVTTAEAQAQFDAEIERLQISKQEFFTKRVMGGYRGTEADWVEENVRFWMTWTKLCEPGVTVSEQELRAAYETKYGEKRLICARTVRLIGDVRKPAPGVIADDSTPPLDPMRDRRWINRAPEEASLQSIADAVFALKMAGDVTALIPVPPLKRSYEIELIDISPPTPGKTFEGEKAAILKEVKELKIARAIQMRRQQLEAQARSIRYHIQPTTK